MATPDASAHPTPQQGSDRPRRRPSTPFGSGALLILIVWAAIFALRLAGPSDLLDNDQVRPASYANDAVVNGDWIVQTDVGGNIASKPPLSTWLIGLLSLPQGHATRLTLAIPSALAVLGCALLTLRYATVWFGPDAGWLGALALLVSPMGAKQVTLVRTDALFAFTVGLAMLLGWSAWRRRRAWVWFYLACAGATLAKSPVGIVIAAGGLLSALWGGSDRERRSEASGTSRALDHAAGIALFLLIAGGWFALAWSIAGDAFIEKLIGDELVGHAALSGRGDLPLSGFYKPPLYYLSRFAPASVFTFIGLWKTWRRPARDPEERRFERFLACAFLVGMIIFCVSPHQRADLLLPLWVPGSLLAGRELAKAARDLPRRAAVALLAAWIAGGLIAMFTYHTVLSRDDAHATHAEGLRQLAREVHARFGESPPLRHLDDHPSFQFFLGTMDLHIETPEAADALASPEPTLVATSTRNQKLRDSLAEQGIEAREVLSWRDETGFGVRIVANEAALRQFPP